MPMMRSHQQNGPPPSSVEMVVPQGRSHSPMQQHVGVGDRERERSGGFLGDRGVAANLPMRETRAGGDAGVLARARAMLDERNGGGGGAGGNAGGLGGSGGGGGGLA